MEYLPKRVKRGMEFLLKTSSKLFNDKKLKPNHEYMPFLIKVIQELKRQGVGILCAFLFLKLKVYFKRIMWYYSLQTDRSIY